MKRKNKTAGIHGVYEPGTQAEAVKKLIAGGMSPDIAPAAAQHWQTLICAPEMAEMVRMMEANPDFGAAMQYGFMQGFVAGHTFATLPLN